MDCRASTLCLRSLPGGTSRLCNSGPQAALMFLHTLSCLLFSPPSKHLPFTSFMELTNAKSTLPHMCQVSLSCHSSLKAKKQIGIVSLEKSSFSVLIVILKSSSTLRMSVSQPNTVDSWVLPLWSVRTSPCWIPWPNARSTFAAAAFHMYLTVVTHCLSFVIKEWAYLFMSRHTISTYQY